MAFRIVVDYDLCDTQAICTTIAPDIFEVGDDDVMHVVNDRPGEDARARVMSAVNSCPKGAISIVDE
jgi:ferredoxin